MVIYYEFVLTLRNRTVPFLVNGATKSKSVEPVRKIWRSSPLLALGKRYDRS
jgi:hypothetical protein